MEVLDVRTKLGLRIAALREARGIRQDELAYAIGISRSYLGQVEAGGRNVSIDNIERIADGLGVPLSVLFDDEVFRVVGPHGGRIIYLEPPPKNVRALARTEMPDPTEAVLAALRDNPQATMPAIAEATGLSRSKVQRVIDHLKRDGLVRREGSRKAGHWVVEPERHAAQLTVICPDADVA